MGTKKGEQRCVLYVGTFLPRECGIATFTNDLMTAMDKKFNPVLMSEVLAMNDDGSNFYNYNSKVTFQIGENEIEDYINAARKINERRDIKIVNIQHEFGIFGSEYGEYLLLFLNEIKKPVVATLHTVVPNPDRERKQVMQLLINKSSAVVVMANDAKRILREHYDIYDQKKIFYIPHGVPQAPFSIKDAKEKININDRIVISTFGLLNRGKGIEYVINALPQIVNKFPRVIYLIIGETHPQVRKREGESYRNELKKIVKELRLEKNIKFLNRYMTLKEIITYLSATDIYVSSSLDENQIVSGTLSYALGCGKAIVSTSTAYAKEVLSKKRGILIDFRNSQSISNAIIELLSNPKMKEDIEKKSYQLGRKMIWPNVAAEYLRVFNKVTKLREDVVKKFSPIRLDHLISLTDNVGIIHHAKHSIPNRKTGYTLDDNARALLVATKHYDIFKSQQSLRLIKIYLSFIHYMQKEDGTFHNLLDYERKFLDESGSEDSFGRALMATARVVSSTVDNNIKAAAKFIFDNSVELVYKLGSLRSKAFSIIGLYHYYKEQKHQDIIDKTKFLADSLVEAYTTNATENWKWFEPFLTYSNGKLPESLFRAYEMTKERKYFNIAIESLEFISKILIVDNKLVLIGNKGWYYKDNERAIYDQQPVDAASMVQAYMTACRFTKKRAHYSNAVLAFNWFLGKNSLNQMMYDEVTSGCFDGLSTDTINLNQGAESTISYLLARLDLESKPLKN